MKLTSGYRLLLTADTTNVQSPGHTGVWSEKRPIHLSAFMLLNVQSPPTPIAYIGLFYSTMRRR